MKKFILVCFTISVLALTSGCQRSNQMVQTPTPVQSVKITLTPTQIPLSRNEIFTLLINAQQTERQSYSKKLTTAQFYDYFKSIYTKSYIDKFILNGGNLKQANGYWVLAYPGSEYIEATYFGVSFDDSTKIDYINDNKIKVSQEYEDGLYNAHTEIITLIKDNDKWLVDDLKWEPKIKNNY